MTNILNFRVHQTQRSIPNVESVAPITSNIDYYGTRRDHKHYVTSRHKFSFTTRHLNHLIIEIREELCCDIFTFVIQTDKRLAGTCEKQGKSTESGQIRVRNTTKLYFAVCILLYLPINITSNL